MNVLEKIFLNSRKDRRKNGNTEHVNMEFFVRCRRTYILKEKLPKRK